jgi:L-alanine-DL-glutamate epimerase-like enolase superfamily enzyme
MPSSRRLFLRAVAAIRGNIPLVEDDRFHNFGIDTSAYAFRDGQWFVPQKPGWGVELSPAYDRHRRASGETVIQ